MTTYIKLVKTAFQKKTFRIHALLGLLGVNFFEHGYDKSHKPLSAKEYFAVIKQAFTLKKHRIRSLFGMLGSDFFDGDIKDALKPLSYDEREILVSKLF